MNVMIDQYTEFSSHSLIHNSLFSAKPITKCEVCPNFVSFVRTWFVEPQSMVICFVYEPQGVGATGKHERWDV